MERNTQMSLADKLAQAQLDDETRQLVLDLLTQQQQERDTLHSIVDHVPSLVCRYNQAGHITYANQTLCTFFDRTAETMIGQQIGDVVPLGTPAQVKVRLQRLFELPTTIVSDIQLRDANGYLTWYQWIETSVTDGDGRVVAVQAYGQDASFRYAANMVLQQAVNHYRTIVQHLPGTLVLMFDREFRYVLAEGTIGPQLKLDLRATEGKTIDAVHRGALLAYNQALYGRILAGETQNFEYEQGQHTYNVVGLPIVVDSDRIDGERVDYGIIIMTDVTAFKQSERARRQTQQQLAMIADNINDVLFVYNPATNVLEYISDAAERVFGLPHQLTNHDPRWMVRYVHPKDRWLVYDYWRDGGMYRADAWLEVRLRPQPSAVEDRWVQIRTFPVQPNSHRTADRVVGVMKDITMQRKSEEQSLSLALERERIRILTEFIDKAAHEFRTPLSIINTNAYLMTAVADAAQLQTYRRAIESQVQSIAYFVERLVLMSKLDGTPALTRYPTALQSIIQETLTKIEPHTRARNITVQASLGDQRIMTNVEAAYIGIAVRELLDNALKAMSNGGTLKIEIKTSSRWYTINVSDSGPGMSPDTLQQIFNRFYRADTAHTTKGFGLGLPIARRIVELHGGHISVESRLGAGSTFTILLPIR